MKSAEKLDEEAIDALYGLEPVFEPGGRDVVNPTQFVTASNDEGALVGVTACRAG
jgi:hypothetical protein